MSYYFRKRKRNNNKRSKEKDVATDVAENVFMLYTKPKEDTESNHAASWFKEETQSTTTSSSTTTSVLSLESSLESSPESTPKPLHLVLKTDDADDTKSVQSAYHALKKVVTDQILPLFLARCSDLTLNLLDKFQNGVEVYSISARLHDIPVQTERYYVACEYFLWNVQKTRHHRSIIKPINHRPPPFKFLWDDPILVRMMLEAGNMPALRVIYKFQMLENSMECNPERLHAEVLYEQFVKKIRLSVPALTLDQALQAFDVLPDDISDTESRVRCVQLHVLTKFFHNLYSANIAVLRNVI